MFEAFVDIALYMGLFFLSSIVAHFAAEKTVEWIRSKEFWHIIVDGETFDLVSDLDVIQKYSEAHFWDVKAQCWRHLKYSRIELYRLRKVEDEDQ